MWLDQLVHGVKAYVPWVYGLLARANSVLTILLHGRRIRRALGACTIEGKVADRPAVVREIGAQDLDALKGLLMSVSDQHLRFFRPHKFDRKSLMRILGDRSVLTYGLFVGDEMVAYALIKLFATKKAYIGRLVSSSWSRMRIGRFLTRYLYWQGYLLGFTMRSTVHRENMACRQSHVTYRSFRTVGSAPGGYDLLEFAVIEEDAEAPELNIDPKKTTEKE